MTTLSPPNGLFDAIERLPHKDHPLIAEDDSIASLSRTRDWMFETITMIELPLYERVRPISKDELTLMEQTSFTRDLPTAITLDWCELVNKYSPWYSALDLFDDHREDKDYSYFRLSFLIPQFNQKHIMLIEVCKDYNHLHKPQFTGDTRYYIVLTDKAELSMLFNELNFDKNKLKEKIERFLAPVYEFNHSIQELI